MALGTGHDIVCPRPYVRNFWSYHPMGMRMIRQIPIDFTGCVDRWWGL